MLFFSLKHAKTYKSKTRAVPFIIANECSIQYIDKLTNEKKTRDREYVAFDDIFAFLEVRNKYPHAHEIVWDSLVPNKQRGRLMFDFDFKTPWYGMKPKFVSPDFEKVIEELVIATFQKFYNDVDTSKFVFVWLVSDTVDKWSKHLIVKNAYFCNDWKLQTLIFYNLMLGMYEERDPFPKPTSLQSRDLIDIQIARTNATMRMCGSSKLNGKVLEIERPKDANFFDTLIQLYQRCDIESEQEIRYDQLNISFLNKMQQNADSDKNSWSDKRLTENVFISENSRRGEKVPFFKIACKYANVDVSSISMSNQTSFTKEELSYLLKVFDEHYCRENKTTHQNVFRYKSVSDKGIIVLERLKPAPCLISGKVHDSSDAYMICGNSGLKFYCYRGCANGEKKCIKLYPNDSG